MKIVLCTTPIRPVPTDYPPFGSLALIQYMRAHGYDMAFYDIDGLRPTFEEAVRRVQAMKPDVICISAVVSTAYGYTHKFCLRLKELMPETPIILGGNLAASAELLHRFCKVDVCVAGEGQIPLLNLIKSIEASGGRLDKEKLRGVRGLTFLDASGHMAFTGYEEAIPPDQFDDPDFEILEKYSRIENFVTDPFTRPDFSRDPRSYEPHRKGQKMSTVLATKGCVARCTFCHRWDKGFRHIPPADIVRRMRHLKEKYNVGFFQFGDENFGSDRKNLDELVRLVKPLDVLYVVSGVRCRSVDPELLPRLKDSGCVGMYYGMETGSPRMLKVMEKNAELEHNVQAALWTQAAGLYTIYQLVLAMPGENRETVEETLEFVKRVTEKREEPPHKVLSSNYIQALPGTPVYEYARNNGYLGRGIEGEADYLMRISDINANDDAKFINFTTESYLTVQTWRLKILFEAEAHWYRIRGWKKPPPPAALGGRVEERDYFTQGGYFNVKKMFHSAFFYRYGWPFRKIYYLAYTIFKDFRKLPFPRFCRMIAEAAARAVLRKKIDFKHQSLRRTMKETAPAPATPTEAGMLNLRLGR